MSKMTEDLKAAGWVETTLGKCQLGDEVLTRRDKKVNVYTTVCGEYEREGLTVTEDGIFHEWTPVLRARDPSDPSTRRARSRSSPGTRGTSMCVTSCLCGR